MPSLTVTPVSRTIGASHYQGIFQIMSSLRDFAPIVYVRYNHGIPSGLADDLPIIPTF
jgi:hypothetical protein